MYQIVQDVRTCLIRHTKGPGKCVRLYRMSEYSDFILVNRNTLRPYIFVGCHMMSENSGVGLRKFHCILLVHIRVSSLYTTGAHSCFIAVYYWCTFVFHRVLFVFIHVYLCPTCSLYHVICVSFNGSTASATSGAGIVYAPPPEYLNIV